MAHAEGISLRHASPLVAPAALQRHWVCPQCTLHNPLPTLSCEACGFCRGARQVALRHGGGGSGSRGRGPPREALASMAFRAAVAGMAGLALGRASAHHRGVQRMAVAALAVAAVPLANALLSRLVGRRGGGGSAASSGHPRRAASREHHRRQLRRAAQLAAEQAAEAGTVAPEERRLLAMVLQPIESRTERVRMIAQVLELLRELESEPGRRSRAVQLVSALVVYELNALVDSMDYEELYAAFGGHPPPKGLAAEELAALPATQLTEAQIGGLHSGTCSVCLDAFQPGERARVLPACHHAFHADCLDPWLQSKALCPVCRTQVEAPAAAAEEAAATGACTSTPHV